MSGDKIPDDHFDVGFSAHQKKTMAEHEAKMKPLKVPMSHPAKRAEETIRGMQDDIVEWADSIFPHREPEAAFRKMLIEIDEWQHRPCDGHEAADVMIMLLDVCHLSGIDIVKAVNWKMKINRKRMWHVNEDGTFTHKEENNE